MNHALIFCVHDLALRRLAGPYRIATFLREHEWDVEVIDYVKSFTLEELKEVAKMRISSKTIFIGFSSFFNAWSDDVDIFIDWIKSSYPYIRIIVGGQSKPLINTKKVDYYIHGYGELAVLELARSFVGNSNNKITLDPLYLGKKKVISANKHYPAFPMNRLTIKYQDRDDLQPWEWLTIECSRGCKFQCPYCNHPVLGVKGDYTRSAEDFKEDMKENWERWGIKNYYMADETFNDHSEKIEKYSDAIQQLNLDTIFAGFIRADLLVSRRRDWEPLLKMGFVGHFYGIETMNYETAKFIGKGMRPEKLGDGLIEVKNYFLSNGPYRGALGIVVGLPHETLESQIKTFNWIEKNWQGECVHAFPLEIHGSETNDVQSTISKDMGKYGYRHSDIPEPEPPEEVKFFGSAETRVKQANDKVIWENDNMTYADACKIVDDFYVKIVRDEIIMKSSIWTFADYTYPDIPLQEVLDKVKYFDAPKNRTGPREREYVEKKLNK
jgi:hypothetical protein